MRRLKHLLVLGAALALALAPSVAHAAPAYVTSDPENHEEMEDAPGEVRVVFDTPLDPGSSLWIVDQCNKKIDDGNVVVAGNAIQVGVAETPKGPYFVQWKVRAPAGVGGDGSGQVTFHVDSGEFCGPPSARVNGDGHEGHEGHEGGGGGHGGHGGGGHGGHGGGGHGGHGGGGHGGGGHGGHGDHGGDQTDGHSDHAAHDTHGAGATHTAHSSGHGNHGNHGNHNNQNKNKGGTPGDGPVAAPQDPTSFAGPGDLDPTVTGDAVLTALLASLVLGAAGGWMIRNLNPS